jgi:hypothetical protein
MSAASALQAARAAGVGVVLDGDQLVLSAAMQPPATVIEALSRHKAEIVSMLGPAADGWSAEDWHAFFDERTGIAEFGGLPRAKAEARAFEVCIVEWLNRNPERSLPRRCHGCGQDEHTLDHDPLLPYGSDATGHAWLHARCWPAWHARRKADAAAALAAMGIVAP